MMLNNDVFFDIVMSALKERKVFSTVRMSDGEKTIVDYSLTNPRGTPVERLFDTGWHQRFGTAGMTVGGVRDRLVLAFDGCTYFCPGAGIQHLFPPHKKPYVDKQHSYEWTRAQRLALLEEAGNVMLINRDTTLLSLFQRKTTAHVEMVKLSNWKETEFVFNTCRGLANNVPLFLLSAGPAGKYLAPAIAKEKNCMVLDVGQGADAWFMPTGAEVGMP